jgi:DNA-directed RNA polymerase subunit E'/Rpb7
MRATKQIKWKTYLRPSFLDGNILSNLLEHIRMELNNKCFEEHGYIISVNRIISVDNNTILVTTSNILFNVTIEVDTLKPEIGLINVGEVFMVIDKGIFVKIEDKLKVLIPVSNLYGYEYKKEDNFYYKKETKTSIYMNDTVKIKILGIQYSKNYFNCFGEIVG